MPLHSSSLLIPHMRNVVAAFLQDRIGPDRAGPFGILQPLADGLKFIMKKKLFQMSLIVIVYFRPQHCHAHSVDGGVGYSLGKHW